MLMISRALSLVQLTLLAAISGCAGHATPARPAPLASQIRLGPAQDFGPGIRDITASDVDLITDVPAYIIALRVTRELGIQVVAPQAGSPMSKPGGHYFRGGAAPTDTVPLRTVSSKTCTILPDSRQSCMGVQSGYHRDQLKLGGATSDAAGYWLLIVSDTPTRAEDVMRRLGEMTLPDTSLVNLVRRIPAPLIASRTTHWAAYYAAFDDKRDP